MSPELSLYKIEADLAELVRMREDVRETLGESATQDEVSVELEAIDTAIREYISAEIRKADSIADYILMMDRLAGEPKQRKDGKIVCELDQEIERLRARRDNLRKRAEHIKGIVAAVMSSMDWKPGKPRKIEGIRHTLALVGNGGKQAVEVYDPSLVPDECCTVTVTMAADLWRELAKHVAECPHTGEFDGRFYELMPSRIPSLSLIGEEMQKRCEHCDGSPAVGTADECQWCGGSGRRPVAGARLEGRGEHLRVS